MGSTAVIAGFTVAGFGAALGLVWWLHRRHIRRLVRTRDCGQLRATFVAYCYERGLLADRSGQVFSYFQELMHQGFPVDLDDHLGDVFGIANEDLWATIEGVANLCHRDLLAREVDLGEVRTVRDVVDLLTRND
jgi:hypothetical protein